MTIDIHFETKSCAYNKLDRLKRCFDVIGMYADENNNVFVSITDEKFECSNKHIDTPINGVTPQKPKEATEQKETVHDNQEKHDCCEHDEQCDLNVETKNPVCPVCKEKFEKVARRQRFCGTQCRQLYDGWRISNKRTGISLDEYVKRRNAKIARKMKVVSTDVKKCEYAHCGKTFKPSTDNQKYCSRECKEAAHKKRVAESTNKKENVVENKEIAQLYDHKCEVCDMPYKDDRKFSRFCPKCLHSFGVIECNALAEDTRVKKMMEAENKKIKYKVCPRCGANFEPKEENQFFCDKCTARANKVPKIEKQEQGNNNDEQDQSCTDC